MPGNGQAGYTMTRQSFSIPFLALMLCLAPAAAMAQRDMRSTSQLLEELTSSFSNARAAEAALKANLAQKNAYQSEQSTVNREKAEYKRESSDYARDLARHNDNVDTFNAECGSGRSYTREQLARCDATEAQLKAAGAALETQRTALEEKRQAVRQLTDAFNQKERERAKVAEALLSRYDEADANIKAILARLTGEAAFSHCAGRSSPEAQQQCILLAYQGSR